MEIPVSNDDKVTSEERFSVNKTFEKIEEEKREIATQLYKEKLKEIAGKNEYLKSLVAQLTKDQIGVRDQIAQAIYIQMYKEAPTAKDAAKDAYEAADIFLRVREDELSVINDIRTFIQNHPDDSELGRKLRSMFGSKINKT